MRRVLVYALIIAAILFLLLELYAATRWMGHAGGLGAAFDHFWDVLRSDWMAQIVVSDHLVIAGIALIALWLDAARRGWGVRRRIILGIVFIVLGSPALLAYIAWRINGQRAVPA
jgi:hypothetical protein